MGADGMNSIVRKSKNIESFGYSYNQYGLVATLKINPISDQNNIAYQKFLKTGPIAFLPVLIYLLIYFHKI